MKKKEKILKKFKIFFNILFYLFIILLKKKKDFKSHVRLT